MIDSHCHLDFLEFDVDRATVVEAACQAGVENIVIPAVSQSTWSRTISTAEHYSFPYALGMHPVFIDQHQPHHLNELDDLVSARANSSQPAIAVGEIGLDYLRKELDQNKQRAYFAKQLIIANRHALPVIIHCLKAHDDCLAMLKEHTVEGGIIHAFNGSIQQANKYIDLGFALGFGGMLTFERSTKLRKLAKTLPLTSLVLETDAPDMVVEKHRGQRNSPAYLKDVAQSLAELRSDSFINIARATKRNTARVLRLCNEDSGSV